MQTRTFLPESADRDHPFLPPRRSAAAAIVASLTLISAFALGVYVVATGWPA
jgi:hypothetical protein